MNFNRLLDYRPLEHLAQMDDSDRAQLFAEIIGKAPSQEAWQALWELFASWPVSAAQARYLDLAEQALAGWDDRLRFAWSSSGLLYEGERLSALARLVKSIEIYRREQYGSAELFAIANSEYSKKLAYLSIVRSDINGRAWRALVESPYLADLQHLHVSKTMLGAADIPRLFQSSGFTRLRCLKLIDVGVTHEELDGVGQSIPFPELHRIDFSYNSLGDEGALLLSQAPWLQDIRRLALRHNYIAAPALRTLLSSPFCRQMKQIDLSENRVTATEKSALIGLAEKNNIDLML